MKHLGFASIPAVLQYLRYAQSLKMETDELVKKAGISLEQLSNENGRIPGTQFQTLIKLLISDTDDQLFGLHSSQFVQPGSYSVLGYIAMSCATIGEAISRIPPFEKLVGDMGVTSIHHESNRVELQWHCAYSYPEVRMQMIDNVLASWTQYARWLANQNAAAESVFLERPDPGPDLRARYEDFFLCPVHFGQRKDSIRLPIELLDLELRQPDRLLLQTLESHALEQISNIKQTEGTSEFTAKVIHALRTQLTMGIAKKDLVAQELHLTERTLQRKLAKEGESYQSLLDRIRLEQADKMLCQSKLSIEEIAYNLGFTDARSFHRRFKHWTGDSPGAYRKRLKH